jgi:hypothetical protein
MKSKAIVENFLNLELLSVAKFPSFKPFNSDSQNNHLAKAGRDEISGT